MIHVSNIKMVDFVNTHDNKIIFGSLDYIKSSIFGKKTGSIEFSAKWSSIFNEYLNINDRETGKDIGSILCFNVESQLRKELLLLEYKKNKKPIDK